MPVNSDEPPTTEAEWCFMFQRLLHYLPPLKQHSEGKQLWLYSLYQHLETSPHTKREWEQQYCKYEHFTYIFNGEGIVVFDVIPNPCYV